MAAEISSPIDQLISEMKSIASFSDNDIALFTQALEPAFIPKGEHFLKDGQVSHHIAYTVSGLTMHYKITDGLEVPADFTAANEWLAYLKSFSTNTPSDMYIKALEDTHLLLLSRNSLEKLSAAQPQFLTMRSYYTERSFIRNVEHAANLASLNAKQRYTAFLKAYPTLAERIPQYYIAAYLGLTPQSLSRLKK
jgi:CRP-like cAMP-binding protein